jgi:hypothetical protein
MMAVLLFAPHLGIYMNKMAKALFRSLGFFLPGQRTMPGWKMQGFMKLNEFLIGTGDT